ncbi:MAG: tetratricopeptide repeat protein [Chloracidobacterium sp.]|nr:tetratricopeptide repeat protein [Chloracidobacterium sp.]
MGKNNILFGIIGLFVGLVIGFMVANSFNKNSTIAASTEMKTNSNLPPGHPAITETGETNGTAPSGGMQPEIMAAIEKAKKSPADFDAQIAAADTYYQIDRYDEAINYLKTANKIKPDDREVIVRLGNANFDAEQFEEAEKWYIAAIAKKADDLDVRTDLGLTFVFREPPNYDRAIQEFNRALEIDPKHIQSLQNITVAYTKKGEMLKATEALAKLEAIEPANKSIARLREEIQNIGAAK